MLHVLVYTARFGPPPPPYQLAPQKIGGKRPVKVLGSYLISTLSQAAKAADQDTVGSQILRSQRFT